MRLSVQLYTVRDALAEDYVGTLKKLKDIGLEYVEGAGNYGGGSAAEGKKILDDLGLKASGSHVGIERLQHSLDDVIEEHQTMGIPFVIIPYLAEGDRHDYTKLAGILEPIGHKLKDKGLTLCYHNHDFEFQMLNDMTGLDILYAKTDPSLLQAELDLAWVQIGGYNPASYVKKYADRTPLVHLKDYDPAKTPRWQPGGQGIVDWDACLAACADAGVQFGAIELDESAGDPIDAVRQSFEFFYGKGLS